MPKADTTPDTFAYLRFPLALTVVFIHSMGSQLPEITPAFGMPGWGYHAFRLSLSCLLPAFAVPLFFLISGYFFFLNMPRWDATLYRSKMKRRLFTLLLPYLLWNLLYALHLSWPTLAPALSGKGSWSDWIARLESFGGWRMFLDGHKLSSHATAPVLVPLWYIRDLMAAVIATPLIYWLIRRTRWLPAAALMVLYIGSNRQPLISCFFWFTLGSTFSITQKPVTLTLSPIRPHLAIFALGAFLGLLATWFAGTTTRSLLESPLLTAYILLSVPAVVCLADFLLQKQIVLPHRRLSESSMFIYLSHIFFLTPVMRIMKRCLPDGSYLIMGIRYLITPIIVADICASLYLCYLRLKGKKHNSCKPSLPYRS